MKTIGMKMMDRLLMAMGLMFLGINATATDVVWIGGASGNANNKENWEGGVAPYQKVGSALYVAVFTNSVTVINDFGYWYLSGFKVRNNSTVTIQGSAEAPSKTNRLQPSDSCTEFVVDVETGSSLSHTKGDASDYAYYAQSKKFVKTGGGTFKPGSRFGWTGANAIGSIEVREGLLNATATPRCAGEIKICSGAEMNSVGFTLSETSDPPVFSELNVEAGGVFNGSGKSFVLTSLSGAGLVTNMNELVMTMNESGKMFNGRIFANALTISNATYTVAGANWTVGAADALKNIASWRFVNDAGVPMEVRFASGIGTFQVGATYPTDRVFYDLDRMPVLLDYCHAVWYADDDNYGKAGMDGKTPETAFGTLQEAMENPSLVQQDTVYVLPGTYDKGEMSYGSEITTNRVVIPYGVKLVATGKPEETVIVGKISTDSAKDKLGNGPGAIRCVKMSNASVLKGFTLTGGRVALTDTGTNSEDGFGGGVQQSSPSTVALVCDCIVSNNAAVRAGAIRSCTTVRCRVFDNRVTAYGHGWYGVCNLYGCVADRNGSSGYAYYTTSKDIEVCNCTFGPNEGNDFRTTKTATDGGRTVIYNSVFLSGIVTPENTGIYKNCVLVCANADKVSADADSIVCSDEMTAAEKLAYVGLDEDLNPLKGGRLVDRGRGDYYPMTSVSSSTYGACDAKGAPRVSNGTIDIGGYEYDWRTDYADSLGSAKKMPIVSASSTVVTNGAGGIVLGNRDVVRAQCVKLPGDYAVSVQVTGEGTLTVELGADDVRTVTAADGPTELKFSVAAVPQDVRFEFAGSGSAKLVAFDYPRTGMLLLLW